VEESVDPVQLQFGPYSYATLLSPCCASNLYLEKAWLVLGAAGGVRVDNMVQLRFDESSLELEEVHLDRHLE
jgi:hypothetical protein